MRRPNPSADRVNLRPRPRFEYFGQGNRPEALVIACTDPLLDTSLLAQLRATSVLVWRSAGPVVPPYGARQEEAEQVIDNALTEFGVKEIAICGHLPCEFLRALVNRPAHPEEEAENSNLSFARVARRVVQEKYGRLEPEEFLQAIVEENVFVQLANLRTYPAVLAGLSRGDLQLHTWIYDADKDELYNHGPSQGRLLGRLKRPAAAPRPLPCLDPCKLYLA